jgi:futalosine hydrolase
MLLLITATEAELGPLKAAGLPVDCLPLVCGVGPVEATLGLTRYLAASAPGISAVVNFGLAGAYPDTGLELLDLCLAEREFLGDFGIILNEKILPLDQKFAPPREFSGDVPLLARAEGLLVQAGLAPRRGNFVTVAGSSGTLARSLYLRDYFQAICENMEGAALARVCQAFGLPFLELRCISNLVLDRQQQVWRAPEAAARCCGALQTIAGGLGDGR